jgi:hypothetical protein
MNYHKPKQQSNLEEENQEMQSHATLFNIILQPNVKIIFDAN